VRVSRVELLARISNTKPIWQPQTLTEVIQVAYAVVCSQWIEKRYATVFETGRRTIYRYFLPKSAIACNGLQWRWDSVESLESPKNI
jgi:hypothetical protein